MEPYKSFSNKPYINIPRRIICILFVMNLPILVNCQEKITLFYNSYWEITSKENASFYREAEYDLNSLKLNGEVRDYTLNGVPLMIGYYSLDKRNGNFIFYYQNGNTKSQGNYKDDRRVGMWDYYYENGKTKQKAIFSEVPGITLFNITEYYDRNGNQLIMNGTGSWINDSIESNSLEDNGLFRLLGQFKDSLRTGTWKLIRISDNMIVHTENFRKGRFLSATVFEPLFNSYGTTNFEFLDKFPDENIDRLEKTENLALDTTVFPFTILSADISTALKIITGKDYYIKNRRAMYPYGDQSLFMFIAANIKYPISALQNKISGKVYIKVVINSLGKPKEVTILKGVNRDLDSEALRVISLIDNWFPALNEGKPVESTISIPVTFEIRQ